MTWTPKLSDWFVDTYLEAPPPRRWLVQDMIPLGTVGLLVAQGKAGKGVATLDLALKVAGPSTIPVSTAFGRPIATKGPAVVFCGEDHKDEIHRRLEALDPGKLKRKGARALYVVSIPSAGRGAFNVTRRDGSDIAPSLNWLELMEQLEKLKPVLEVFDPLQKFTRADITKSPEDAVGVVEAFADHATKIDAAVILTHHTRKQDNPKVPIASAAEARALIRGVGALVDSVRWAYMLWPMVREQAQRAAAKFMGDPPGAEPAPDAWYCGAMVASNAPHSAEVEAYHRDPRSGLLTYMDERQRMELRSRAREELLLAIEAAYRKDRPFQRTSNSDGLWERRGELPASCVALGRRKLEILAGEMVDKHELQVYRRDKGARRYLRPAPAADATPDPPLLAGTN